MSTRYTLHASGLPEALVLDAEDGEDPRAVFLQLARGAGLVPGQARSFTRQGPPLMRTGFAGESGTATLWEAAPTEEILDSVRAA